MCMKSDIKGVKPVMKLFEIDYFVFQKQEW